MRVYIMVNRQKIMIVDDDENIAELISLYLTKECFNTRIVHDAKVPCVNLILTDRIWSYWI